MVLLGFWWIREAPGRSALRLTEICLRKSPMKSAYALTVVLVLAATSACSKKPAAPFDTLPTSNLTAFRLQNYEPPPPPAGAAPQPGMIPGLPPEIQQWVQQGAQGLQQLIPPGLIPPGMIPGVGAPAPTAAPTPENVPRFHGFRILGQTQVIDEGLKEELADILGKEGNFEGAPTNCMYAEMGLSFSAGGPPNDVLISFSCNQVNARTFAWPHPSTGMTPSAVKELSEVVQNLWPPGM